MWRAVNLSEVPLKITQFGKEVIVPYNRQIVTFDDDSVFEQYKSLFHIVEEPPKKVEKPKDNRPLAGVSIKKSKVV